jgi:glycosyltransferase involved in cell wall biosynthesis
VEYFSYHKGDRPSAAAPHAGSASRELHVLHVSPSFYPATYWGGPMYSVHGLCNHLAHFDGVVLRVATTDSAGSRASDRVAASAIPMRYPDGYDVYFFRRQAGASVSGGLLKNLPGMIRWADVVHLTGVFSFPTIPTFVACRLFGKPLVWSPRGAFYRRGEARRRTLKKQWLRVCRLLVPGRAVIHCSSQKEREEAASSMPGVDTAVIPNGVDVPREVKPARSSGKEGLSLLFLGLISPVKALDALIRAVALLDNGVRLDVCGHAPAGYERYGRFVESLVAQLGLKKRVVFHGFVQGQQKTEAWMRADVCVVPSHSENFSNVVTEALAFGVPVIVSKGAPWAEVESVGCGLWVENTPESLANAIDRIRQSDLARMGANGRLWVSQAFTWDAVARTMLDTYRRVALRG